MNIYDIDFINIDGNYIHKTAIIYPNVTLGKGNIIGAYTVIGANGEMRKPKDFNGSVIDFHKLFKGSVIIGDNNVISEHVTIQRPFDSSAHTYIGNDNIIMAHSHIGHDASIGNNCELCTGVIVGGYASIQSDCKIKLGVTIRNRINVGRGVTIGMQSAVTKDVQSGLTVYGVPAK